MTIILNGAPVQILSTSLADAMTALGFSGRLYATAVNGVFVRATARQMTPLKDGDKVEIVSPRAGG